MDIEALLCDAATVRENLLHILGGGITRIWRASFPAPLGLDLALVFTMSPLEAQERHKLKVVIQTEDGRSIAQISGEFGISPSPAEKPGEKPAKTGERLPGERFVVPVVLPLKPVPIPKEGVYSVEVLIDGQTKRSFTFLAAKPLEEKA